jgi:hypothetical protein
MRGHDLSLHVRDLRDRSLPFWYYYYYYYYYYIVTVFIFSVSHWLYPGLHISALY